MTPLAAAPVPPPIPESAEAGPDHNRFIDVQLQKTRRRVKWVDAVGGLLLLLAGTLVYLLAMVLVDHWLVSGGLGLGGRVAALALFLAGAAFYTVRTLVPLVVRRINPVYAAGVIERGHPSLKNSLINLLLLRSDHGGLPAVIYQGMEHQAATNLSEVPIEGVVDRSKLIKLGYAMIAIVAVICLYKVISPKDPIRSMERVIAPWADIDPPTRVTIAEVEPRDSRGYLDQRVTISARINGIKSGEPVTLHYSTADGQVVDQTLKMSVPDKSIRYAVEVPDGSTGLQQDLEYFITAGDATSRPYHIKVERVPSIVVDRIEYKYPAYTEIEPQIVEKQGDLRAMEGTEVTIHAKASHDIKSAFLDFERDGRRDLTLAALGRDASCTLTLKLKPKSDQPEHANYQLIFTNNDGADNPRPIEYKIDVIRDLPPEIAFVDRRADAAGPKDKEKDKAPPGPAPEQTISASGGMNMALEASDPDFKLADVTLFVERNGTRILSQRLLPEPTRQPLRSTFLFDAKKYKLQAGDTIVYWAAAEDNKQPKANRTETQRYTLRIASPDQQKPDPDQLAKNDPKQGQKNQNQPQDKQDGQQPNQPQQPKGDQPNNKQSPNNQQKPPQERQPNENTPADQQPGGNPPNGPGGQQGQPGHDNKPEDGGEQDPPKEREPDKGVDPQSQPGDAIEKINEHFDKKNPPDRSPDKQNNQPDQKPQDNKQQDNGQQGKEGQQPSGDQQPGQNQQPGGKKPEGNQNQPGGQGQKQQPMKGDQPKSDDAGNNGGQKSGQQTQADPNARGKEGGQDSSGSSGGQEKKEKSTQQPSGDKPSGENGPETGGLRERQDPNKSGSKSGAAGDKSQGNQEQGKQEQGKPGDGNQAAGEKGSSDKQDKQGDPSGMKKDGSAGEKTAAKPGEKGGEQPQAAGEKNGQQPAGGEKPGDKKDAQPKDGQGGGGKPDKEQHPNKPDEGGAKKPGEGAQTAGGNEQGKKEQQPGSGGDQKDKAKGGDRENSKGSPGAGKPGQDKEGSPSAQENAKPREKQPGGNDPSPDQKKEGDPSSPSGSKKESNSEGASNGDRSGGGEKGGGQKSSKSGTGGAGTNTDSEQGGSKSDKSGDGETSDKGGDKDPAGKPKDNASSQGQGAGQKTRPGGNKPDEGGKENGGEKPQDPSQKPSQSPAGNNPGLHGAGNPVAGGQGDDKNITPPKPQPPQAEPGGEDPNLEYARQATDLAIDRLKDQLKKGQPDQELLDKLKWTREDVERFVKHWDQLKRDAQQPGADAARDELKDALRSLGLRPHGTSLSGDKARADKARQMRESRRSSPPPEYAEQFRAFSKGTSEGSGEKP